MPAYSHFGAVQNRILTNGGRHDLPMGPLPSILVNFAVALYSYEDDPHYVDLRDALLAGYRAVRPFVARDAELLPLFLLLRRLVILGWIWDRPELGHGDRLPEQIDVACARVEAFDFALVMQRIRE